MLTTMILTIHHDHIEYTDNIEQLPPDIMEALRHGGGVQIYDQFQQARNPTIHSPTNNPFALFLNTLLPWNPIPNAPAEDSVEATAWYQVSS
jgi:hypothetical protein